MDSLHLLNGHDAYMDPHLPSSFYDAPPDGYDDSLEAPYGYPSEDQGAGLILNYFKFIFQ